FFYMSPDHFFPLILHWSNFCYCLFSSALIQTTEVSQQISLTVVEPGDNVTLICPVADIGGKFFNLYKQSLGRTMYKVAAGVLGAITVNEQFKDSRFTVTKEEAQYLLTIRNVSKEDEATYFCQNGTAYSQTFGSGTFLAVNGKCILSLPMIMIITFKSNSLDCDFLTFFKTGSHRLESAETRLRETKSRDSISPAGRPNDSPVFTSLQE
uniref:Ig-like domain-containing protein n=1 Tax=Lates calcarifer TaxID=8187 RepID=A0A4W6FAK5_LATCA